MKEENQEELLKRPYWELLKHPKWQHIRLLVIEREKGHCEECYDDQTTLHVHHSYYEKDLLPWQYPLESLHCLCEPCHKRHQKYYLQIKRLLGKIRCYDVTKVIGYLTGLVLQRTDNQDEKHAFAWGHTGNDCSFEGLCNAYEITVAPHFGMPKWLVPCSCHDEERHYEVSPRQLEGQKSKEESLLIKILQTTDPGRKQDK